jgi:hypothetical protein
MQDLLSQLTQIRRPRLLVRAARIAVKDYRRDTRLPRILGYGMLPRTGLALVKLMALESELNEQRTRGDACYSIATHVEVLTAVMGESALLKAQTEAARLT